MRFVRPHLTMSLGLTAVLAAVAVGTAPGALATIEPVSSQTLDTKLDVKTPWKANRGTLPEGYGTSLAGTLASAAASSGTELLAILSGYESTPGLTIRGAYAWVSCPSPIPTGVLVGCSVAQTNPVGPTEVSPGENRVRPLNNAWTRAGSGVPILNVTSKIRLTDSLVGRWVALQAVVETFDAAGHISDQAYYTSPSVLVMPANATTQAPAAVTTAAPQAGGTWDVRGTSWGGLPGGTAQVSNLTTAWLCQKAAAATDTSLVWDVANKCTRLAAASAQGRLSGTLPADAAGKYLVANTTLTSAPTATTSMPGQFTFDNRSAAVLVTAPGQANAQAGAAPADPAADPAADSGSGSAPAAGDSSGTSGTASASGSGSNAGSTSGSGVATAGSTTSTSGATMSITATPVVKAGRKATVTAAISPTGRGVVSIVLTKALPSGKVVSGKGRTAIVKKGKAARTWRVSKSMKPGAYTAVVSYTPRGSSAPIMTATAPMRIR